VKSWTTTSSFAVGGMVMRFSIVPAGRRAFVISAPCLSFIPVLCLKQTLNLQAKQRSLFFRFCAELVRAAD
jgi:hypothetical protein